MLREYMLSLGYKNNEINKILSSKKISKYSEDVLYRKLNEKFSYFLDLGYKIDEIIIISVINPDLFSSGIDIIDRKIENILDLGYTKEEVLMIVKQFPIILSHSVDSVVEKKRFYDSVGLGFIILKEPKKLMQSVELSYARYMFYRTLGIRVCTANYRNLFITEKQFISKYGKNNKTLMAIYNYDDYIDRKKKKMVKEK